MLETLDLAAAAELLNVSEDALMRKARTGIVPGAKIGGMPPDAEVFHLWDGELRTGIELVWLTRGGDVATSDFDQVCYSTQSRPSSAPTSEEQPYWYPGRKRA